MTSYSTSPGKVQIVTAEVYDADPRLRVIHEDVATFALVVGAAIAGLHFRLWRSTQAAGARKSL